MAISSPHVLTTGELRPTNGSDQMASFGHPSKFQRVTRLGFVTAATSLTRGQLNFARCLDVSWAGTLDIHSRGLLPPDGILPGAKFTLRPSLVFYIGSVTTRHSSSGRLPNFAPPIFGRAAITLGIGPHSSCYYYTAQLQTTIIHN